MSKKENSKQDKKVLKMNLCDPDSYKQIMTDCLDAKDLQKMNVNHMANMMALFAESLITYHPRIADLMECSSAVEYTINVKHASDKDTLKMKSKPVSAIDDTFTATCEDPDQGQMDFEGSEEGSKSSGDHPNETKLIDAPDDSNKRPLEIGMKDDVIDAEVVEGGEDE